MPALDEVYRKFGEVAEAAQLLLLANALAERNQPFHSFYRKHNFRRNSKEGRAKMLEDLDREDLARGK
jgi:hypothetical protein